MVDNISDEMSLFRQEIKNLQSELDSCLLKSKNVVQGVVGLLKESVVKLEQYGKL
jgi:hypothetical protein